MKQCFKCNVTGRVQGVFFRQGAKKRAEELGLTGWVRNEDDGSVTLIMCSDDEDAITDMQSWLHHGPTAAQVLTVEVGPCPTGDWKDFKIK
jgi:acylphosphatase